MPQLGRRRDAHLPLAAVEPVGGWTTWVCDAWPVRRQTYGYLPSLGASPPFDYWYQILLLGDRGTCVWTTCLTSLPGSVLVRSRTCATEWPQNYKSGTENEKPVNVVPDQKLSKKGNVELTDFAVDSNLFRVKLSMAVENFPQGGKAEASNG